MITRRTTPVTHYDFQAWDDPPHPEYGWHMVYGGYIEPTEGYITVMTLTP